MNTVQIIKKKKKQLPQADNLQGGGLTSNGTACSITTSLRSKRQQMGTL